MSVPQVLGPYQLKAKLAVGGHSEVWLAVRRGPGGFRRRCALKLLMPPASYEDETRKAFIAEARLTALFDHRNVIPVTDLGEDQESGVVFATMPYVSGTTLAPIVREAGFDGMAPVEAIWLVSQVLLGLDYAHNLRDQRGRRLNIIHRDVSPENVLIGFDGRVHLIDFGIALSNINPRNTRFHVVKGKLDFLSPEQATASPRIDQKTDIYSAGLLLYLLLAAHNPLDGEENTALERARNPTIPRIDSLVTIPVELTQLVHSMLSPIPDERPGDAGATARGLLALLHRLEPGFDEIAFADSIRERLADEIQAEETFLNGMGEGTQIIRTGDLPEDALQSGEFQPKPSAQSHDDLNAKARRDETTPIVAADDIIKSAIPEEKRSSGREQTKDDLQAILAELEDIYDD